jgi:hypothetical protein
LPLTRPNNPQLKHAHKIHAQSKNGTAPLIQIALHMKHATPETPAQIQTKQTMHQMNKAPNTRTNAAKLRQKKRSAQM